MFTGAMLRDLFHDDEGRVIAVDVETGRLCLVRAAACDDDALPYREVYGFDGDDGDWGSDPSDDEFQREADRLNADYLPGILSELSGG